MSIDQDALRRRYELERERRLRSDGVGQYRQASGALSRYMEDPHADPDFRREPIVMDLEVLVIGGGMGGLMMGAQLRQAGVDDFRIVDRGADFGGVWYWNRYPGAACDTESYIYLPLLEETGYMPTEKYAKGDEIRTHLQRIGRHFDLYPQTLFQTSVTEARWDAEAARWRVSTDRGDQIAARFVVQASGIMTRPKLPGLPGLETFKGASFHTARWDFDYTGGSAAGGLEKLRDKRVGVIGTGATGVQCVPHLGEWAERLYVFQRTPSPINRRDNRPTDPAWAAAQGRGWQRERMANFTAVVSGDPVETDLVDDGWTEVIGDILLRAMREQAAGRAVPDPAALMLQADDETMEKIRARVSQQVRDQAAAEALKPWYGAFCKRMCFHDAYLETFNRPNVTLVDTAGVGVEAITEHGVLAGGEEYPLDCLIFATGFSIEGGAAEDRGYEIIGRGGLSMAEKWSRRWSTLHGYMSRDFPNFLMMGYAQVGQSPNYHHVLDEQSRHVAYIISRARERGVASLEPEADAEESWAEKVIKAGAGRALYLSACTPGYYNAEGAFDEKLVRSWPYWKSPTRFFQMTARWREEDAFAGLEINRTA